MDRKSEIETLVQQASEKRDAWLARDLAVFATKQNLVLSDWVEITGISGDEDGLHGMYKIDPEAISFVGWPMDFIRSQPEWEQVELLRQNDHRLAFPCTSRELVAFVDADEGFCGSLYGVIGQSFREAVKKSPTPSPCLLSDAALGMARRQQMEKFAQKSTEAGNARANEHKRWAAAGVAILGAARRKLSLRELATKLQSDLPLTDSVETIRKAIAPYISEEGKFTPGSSKKQ